MNWKRRKIILSNEVSIQVLSKYLDILELL
jgi:hypothetical protein